MKGAGRRWPAALVGSVGLALLGPMLAAGHAELASSFPGDGASVPEAPPTLTMTFVEPIDPVTAFVELVGADQVAIPGLGTLTVDLTGTTATVPLPTLPPGIYTVHYRITSAVDGHSLAGSWSFLVDPTGTRPPPGVAGASSSLSSDPPTVLARWLALLAGLALLGTTIFWVASARPALTGLGIAAPSLTVPWITLAACSALAFSALAVHLVLAAAPLSTAAAPGRGGGFPLDFAAPFGTTWFALAMRISLVGSGAALLLALSRQSVLAVGVAAALFLGGLALAGHPASSGGALFGVADWLHLVAVATWLGTLPGFFLLVRRLRDGEAARTAIGAVLRRHSRLAMVAAPVVALTGVANSPLLLGSSRALVASDYGNLLIAKALLFSLALAIGSANFFLVRAGSLRRSLPLIGVELVIGVAAVLVASGLATAQPAASRPSVLVRPAIGATQLFGAAGETAVHLVVNLPAPGLQRYQVSVADALSGAFLTDVEQVTLVFRPPAGSGLTQRRVPLAHSLEPWLWGVAGAYTPAVGEWRLGVVVLRAGRGEASTIFDLTVMEPVPPELAPPRSSGIDVPAPLSLIWGMVPAGAAGWVATAILFAMAVGLARLDRGGSPSRLGPIRAAALVLALVVGLTVAGRTALEVANAPPEAAAAAVNPIDPDEASVERGRRLYLANCSSCHGASGTGDGPAAAGMLPGAGDLRGVVPDLGDGTLEFRIGMGEVGTQMPAFAGVLTQNDRWDLVNYLRGTFAASR